MCIIRSVKKLRTAIKGRYYRNSPSQVSVISVQNVPSVRVMFCDLSFRAGCSLFTPLGIGRARVPLAPTGRIETLAETRQPTYHKHVVAESTFIELCLPGPLPSPRLGRAAHQRAGRSAVGRALSGMDTCDSIPVW